MEQEQFTERRDPEPTVKHVPILIETVGDAEKIEERDIELFPSECAIPAEDVAQAEDARRRPGDDPRVRRRTDAGESIIA